ncbi:hypothetical protein NEF87_003903 [Candidatus Lokiarchaeum ossiferum]|uniref:Esterase n=1 Tax=Candidatus Lokiarchaeum ossiferum TaxID=2951803 RepID=A0ABY6HVR3_9ARCH|nr:hypothetical protein NEF87_003903 [Candidatus Lokiarchaeum sp. B-35]
MREDLRNQRYKVDKVESKALEGNPLKVTNVRDVSIYLPPSYFEDETTKFPVIYLLHGYGGSITDLIVGTQADFKRNYPLILRILLKKVFSNLTTFEKLDQLIMSKEIPPFILVQPDGSLRIHDMFETKNPDGSYKMKGSFYVNSPFTGNYNDFIFEEVPSYIEQKYRVKPQKESRALIGGSMGGYGALLGGMKYPDQYNIVVALSPLIIPLNLFNVEMMMPIYRKIYGKKKAKAIGQKDIDDIRDSSDLIFSHNAPVIPTMQKNDGKIILTNQEGIANWQTADLTNVILQYPSAFKDLTLILSCDILDEYHFAPEIREFHQVLLNHNIPHEIDIYEDSQAEKISPHTLGIGNQILPSIKRCLNEIK